MYILNPLFEVKKRFFNEFFLKENSAFINGWYSRTSYNGVHMVLIKIETLLLTNNSVFHVLGGDETSFIKDFNTKKVLGLENSATIDGTDVILELEDKSESMSQKWVLIPYTDLEDAKGKKWFMVKNMFSERFLTASDSENLKIRGNILSNQ